MESDALAAQYRCYIDCLNGQRWDELALYVDDEVVHNGRPFGLSGYRDMLVRDFEDIPDLRFEIALLASDPPLIAARLAFHCAPRAKFLGLDIDGRRVSFAEHVFYAFKDVRIVSVWSILDKSAIEAQLASAL